MPPPSGGFLRRLVLIRKGRPGLAFWPALLFALYAAGLGVLLPHFARPYLEKRLSDEFGVACSIRRLAVNPFTLKIIARGMDIPYPESARGKAGEYLLRLERLELTPSLRSFTAKTLIADNVRLVRPLFTVARFADGSLSPQVFFPESTLSETKRDDDDDLFPLVIHTITVEDGCLDITDALRGTAYTVTDLNLAVPFASTLRDDRDVPLTPSLTAVVNGKSISITGESRPFAATRQTVFTLRTQDLNLPDFEGYIRPYTSLSLKSGLLHTELTLRFAQDAEKAFDFSLAGTVAITDLILADKGETVLKLGKAAVDAENVVLGPRRVIINHAEVENPEIIIRKAKNGAVNWAGFLTLPEDLPQSDVRITSGSGAEVTIPGGLPGTKQGESPPLQLVIKESRISGGKITWHDATPKTPVRYVTENINGSFTDVSNQDQGRADFSLSFGKGSSTLSATGTAMLRPMRAEGSLSAEGLALAPFYPYLPQTYMGQADLVLEGGTLGVSGDFAFQYGPDAVARIANGKVSLAGLRAHAGAKTETPLASVRRIAADAITADLVRRTVHIGAITGTGIETELTKKPEGLVLPAFPPASASVLAPESGTKSAAAATDAPWQISVASLSVTQSGVSFTDESLRRKTTLSLANMAVKGKNFANHGNKRWDLSVSGTPGVRVSQRGQDSQNAGDTGSSRAGQGFRGELALSAHGTLAPLNLRFAGKMEKADLRPLSPYIQEVCRLRLSEATLGGDFTGALRRVPNSERGGEFAIKGNLGVYGLSLVHDRKETAGWGRMRVANFNYRVPASGGRTCSIESITVNNPHLAVTIDEKGVSTLAAALEPRAGTGGGAGGATSPAARDKAAPSAKNASVSPAFAEFTIGKVTLSQGRATYTDMRVTPPHTLRVDAVNATAGNLSLDDDAYASFTSSLMINGSPVTASAVLQSVFNTPSGNGTLSIRSLDLSRFAQYAEKYLGYTLPGGELTLSAIGSLKGRDISIHNSVLIRNLDLGEKVNSPHAPNMPISAAVGLLRDSNGDISLELPVAGTLGDPEFKIGGVVGKVIGNVILKTVTSPLALMGGVLSGFIDLLKHDGPKETRLVFPIGEDVLDSVARESLKALGKELHKHPRAIAEITGMADMGERSVLIEAWVAKMLRQRKYDALPPAEQAGTTPEAMLVGPEHDAREYSRLLFELYASLPFVKKSDDPEIKSPQSARAIMRILKSRLDIGEKELALLARSRAVAVYHALSGGNINIAARIRIMEPVLLDAEKTGDRLSSYARVEVK